MCKKIKISYDVVNKQYNEAEVRELDKEIEDCYLSNLLTGEFIYIPSIAHEGIALYKDDDGKEKLYFDNGIIKVEVYTNDVIDEVDLKNIAYNMQEVLINFVDNLVNKYNEVNEELRKIFKD